MPIKVWGAPEGWDAFLLAQRRREHTGSILHVTRDDARMARLAEALAFVMPEAEILRFPAWDCLPYDRVSPNPALVSERIATLARLLDKPTRTAHRADHGQRAGAARAAARRRSPAPAWSLTVNGEVKPEKLAEFLEANGYGRAGTVMEPGEYAMRGGIIDIFPAGETDPVRLDLFGDTIESIRMFDASSRSAAPASGTALSLRPVSEVPLGKESIARFRTGWRDLFGQEAAQGSALSVDLRRPPPSGHGALGAAVPSDDGKPAGLPAGRRGQPGSSVRRGAGSAAGNDRRPRPGAEGACRATARCRIGRSRRSMLYLDRDDWDEMLSFGPLLAFTPFAKPDGAGGVDGGGRPGRCSRNRAVWRGGGGPGITVFDQLRGAGGTLDAARAGASSSPPGPAARASGWRNLLREHGFKDVAQEDDWASVRRKPAGSVSLVVLGVERGFVAERLALVGEQDLLGERISRPPRRRKRADQFIAEATEIAEGDLVVHQEYGIGRYDGLATLQVTGAPHDCLRLIYDGDEKLFLPVENIEVLSRYGSEHQGTALDKLGGAALADPQGEDEAAHPRHGG